MNLKEWALLFLVVLSLTSCSKSTEVTDFEPNPLTIYLYTGRRRYGYYYGYRPEWRLSVSV